MARIRNRPEQKLQQEIGQYLDFALPKDAFWFAVPNAARRGVVEAMNFKRMGMKAGIPDIVIIHCGLAFACEIKTGKGKLSPAQVLMHYRLARAGMRVAVCRSIEDVETALVGWAFPLAARFRRAPKAA